MSTSCTFIGDESFFREKRLLGEIQSKQQERPQGDEPKKYVRPGEGQNVGEQKPEKLDELAAKTAQEKIDDTEKQLEPRRRAVRNRGMRRVGRRLQNTGSEIDPSANARNAQRLGKEVFERRQEIREGIYDFYRALSDKFGGRFGIPGGAEIDALNAFYREKGYLRTPPAGSALARIALALDQGMVKLIQAAERDRTLAEEFKQFKEQWVTAINGKIETQPGFAALKKNGLSFNVGATTRKPSMTIDIASKESPYRELDPAEEKIVQRYGRRYGMAYAKRFGNRDIADVDPQELYQFQVDFCRRANARIDAMERRKGQKIIARMRPNIDNNLIGVAFSGLTPQQKLEFGGPPPRPTRQERPEFQQLEMVIEPMAQQAEIAFRREPRFDIATRRPGLLRELIQNPSVSGIIKTLSNRAASVDRQQLGEYMQGLQTIFQKLEKPQRTSFIDALNTLLIGVTKQYSIAAEGKNLVLKEVSRRKDNPPKK